jgi:hypothetical protein
MVGLGEYREAALQLCDARALLITRLPRPTVRAGAISYPEYGLTLKNPLPARWEARAERAGSGYLLALQDAESSASIAIFVIDPIVLYGPGWLTFMGPTATESEIRDTLSSMGHKMLARVGKNIEGEQFQKANGRFVYEASVKATDPHFNTTCRVIRGGKAIYSVMMMGTAEELAECAKVVDANLEIRDEAGRE